jgi:hypothetical protein
LLLDQSHHVLACASCGAPLRDLKQIPRKAPQRKAVTHQPVPQGFVKITPVQKVKPAKPSRPPKRKKRKGWFGKKFKDMAEDIFDVVEDIFD